MKTAIIASLFAASASAFAPAQQGKASSALSASKFSGELGAQPPLGFFDPLGMVGNEDETRFNRLREVEVKHGRVAMLAVVGYLTTTAGVRAPGMDSMPAGFGALDKSNWDSLAADNMAGTVIFIGLLELFMKDHYGLAEFPGDYRNGSFDFGWDSFDEATKQRKRAIELNNGRAAQMGILGLMGKSIHLLRFSCNHESSWSNSCL